MFRLRPAELDEFTVSQLRTLADRADTLVRAQNAAAEET